MPMYECPYCYTPVEPGTGPSGPFDLGGFVEFAENPTADGVAFQRNGFVSGWPWLRPRSKPGEPRT